MASNFKSLKAKEFLPMLSDRQARFNAAKAELVEISDNATALAKALHPKRQYLKIEKVTERGEDCRSFTLVPDTEKGTTSLAYFGAGKYLTVFETIEGMPITRAYSISSSPKDSLEGKYVLTIKLVEGGLMSKFIFDTWKEGRSVEVSAPAGNFEYQELRDAKKVICLAGGSGITPFVSMANAIKDGDEDFEMVLLYGSRNYDNILFKDELAALEKECDKIKVVHVLSDEKKAKKGTEKGFITAELIKKYAPENEEYSVFICGPQQMYDFLDGELEKLGKEKKYIRHEMFGEFHNPASESDYPAGVPEEVKITVTIQDETYTVTGKTGDSVMQTLEKNKIAVPARCRSGECGFCHSHLLSGKVYVPEALEYRRLADYKFGCIHPCCSFPLTDLVINVPVAK
ncbi:MAG: iron-sulfur cluster-binding domain-containing protein [Clostridia bacterium]|nr:iron-sulfur cluster-binding domain-containing protein [Clostridia bacterium]MBQ1994557.1 iron-sulfur cluster-binding domain-containing protein [Clostridia bacterium]